MDGIVIKQVQQLSIDEKAELYNYLAETFIEIAEKDDGIIHHLFKMKLVRISELCPNQYNPNKMPKLEMTLLWECIKKFGFLFPIITKWDAKIQQYKIIDGYHRYEDFIRAGCKWISIIDLDIPYHDAVQLTVLMNRIKGMHQVELMSDLVVNLENLGLMDEEICKNLGMEPEEYLRLKQQLGIAHSFRNHQYSRSWE